MDLEGTAPMCSDLAVSPILEPQTCSQVHKKVIASCDFSSKRSKASLLCSLSLEWGLKCPLTKDIGFLGIFGSPSFNL